MLETNKIRIFEMFAGYGSASFALKKANIQFECIGYSEIDKYAIKCYEQNHPNIKNYGDCKLIKTEELPDFDLLTGGFPCQDVSISGNRDLSKGRTNLYKEMLRIAKIKKPKYILMENVKGLLSMDCEVSEEEQIYHKKLMEKIVFDLKTIGYGVAYKVLNSKDYGIPQNRERVWIVCKFGGWGFMEFMFPEKKRLDIFLFNILEKNVEKKYFLSEKQNLKLNEQKNHVRFAKGNICPTLKATKDAGCAYTPLVSNNKLKQTAKIGKGCQGNRIYDPCNVSITLNAIGGGKGGKTGLYDVSILDKFNNRTYFDRRPCLTDPKHNNLFVKEQSEKEEQQIRKLIPKECFRLMGFSDNEINLDGLSDTQCYKLAGNGWDINLVSLIFKNLFGGSIECNKTMQES